MKMFKFTSPVIESHLMLPKHEQFCVQFKPNVPDGHCFSHFSP